MASIAVLCKKRAKRFRSIGTIGPPKRQTRERDRDWHHRPTNGTYRDAMTALRQQQPDDEELRRIRVGQFVTRVMEAAMGRGMTIKAMEKAAGVGKSTMYRWARGEVVPSTDALLRFATGLGASREDALAALAPRGASSGDQRARHSPEPIVDDPDIRLLMRKLSSPKTTPAEKAWIRRQIRSMADAIGESDTEE